MFVFLLPLLTWQVVSKLIDAVGFSFYTDEEVHAISVKHITAPVLLDTLNRPVPGGLYDPSLGPLEQTGRLETSIQVLVDFYSDLIFFFFLVL